MFPVAGSIAVLAWSPNYKAKYRVANWPAYNQALVRRIHATTPTGIAAADFSRIRNADLGRFTVDRLMAIINRLGSRIEIKVRLGVIQRPDERRTDQREAGGYFAEDKTCWQGEDDEE